MSLARAPIGMPLWIGEFEVDSSYRVQREHGTLDRVVMVTEGGQGRVAHRGGWILVGPRDLITIDAGRLHDYGTDPACGRWSFIGLHVQVPSSWQSWWQWPVAAPGIALLHLDDAERFKAVCLSLRLALEHHLHGGRFRVPLAMNALECALLTATEASLHDALAIDPRLRTTVERVERDLAHPWTIAVMAGIAGLSSSRFSHLFRDAYGETPRQFLERRRLEEAASRLRATAFSVERIASDLGFTDGVQFSRRFRRLYGQPPGRWRSLGHGPGAAAPTSEARRASR